MRIDEIRAMSDDAILDSLEDKKEELWVLRRNDVSGELTDTNMFKKVRRDVARLKTVLRERELAAQAVAGEENNGQ